MQSPPRPPSTLDLLSTTPMRDLLRGRLTGRLDVPSALEDLDLPPEIESRIIKSVDQAGIPTLHRPVIAHEFGTMARGRLDDGLTPVQVVAEWGSRRRISRRMQRVHDLAFRVPLLRRLRRAAWRRGRWALLTFAIVYAVAAVRFWTGKPSVSRNYAAEWNARIEQIPDDQRGFPLYLEAWRQYENPIDVKPSNPDVDFLMEWQTAFPGDAAWPETLAYLNRNARWLELVRQGAERPYFGWIMSDGANPELQALGKDGDEVQTPNPFALEWRFTHLGHIRALVRWLNIDARAAVAGGDPGRAHADVMAILGLAEQSREQPIIIADMVSVACMAVAAQAIAEHLHTDPNLWSEDQLASLQSRLSGFAGGGEIALRVDYEQAVFADFLQRMYTDNGAGDGRITAEGIRQIAAFHSAPKPARLSVSQIIGGPLYAIYSPSRRQLRLWWDQRIAADLGDAAKPPWQSASPIRGPGGTHHMYTLAHLLVPRLDLASLMFARGGHDREATVAILAMHRFRLSRGRWPSALNELTPEYLSAVPIDRTDGLPLRYRVDGDAALLYSVGQDFDDDGGVRGANEDGTAPPLWLSRDSQDRAIDGDFIHWPPYPLDRTLPALPSQEMLESAAPNLRAP